MLIVRFVRKDGKPNEEYYYQHLNEALYHIHLFKDDDSGYYDKIELEVCDTTGRSNDSSFSFFVGSGSNTISDYPIRTYPP